MSFKEDVFADYRAVTQSGRRPNWLRVVGMLLRSASLRVAFYYRIGHRLRRRRIRILAGIFDRLIHWSGLSVSTAAEIGKGLRIPHPQGVVIGGGVKIGERAYILQGVTLGGEGGKRRGDGQTAPRLGDDVLLGAGAKLLGPIIVGNRVKIGANAVVTSDLPDDCTAVGIPARVVRAGGKRISLLEQTGELPRLLNEILAKLDELEGRIGKMSDGLNPSSGLDSRPL